MSEEKSKCKPKYLAVTENDLNSGKIGAILLFTNIKQFVLYLTERFALSLEESLHVYEKECALIYPHNPYGTKVITCEEGADRLPKGAVDFACVDVVYDLRTGADEKSFEDFIDSVQVLVGNVSENPDDYPNISIFKRIMFHMERASKFLGGKENQNDQLVR